MCVIQSPSHCVQTDNKDLSYPGVSEKKDHMKMENSPLQAAIVLTLSVKGIPQIVKLFTSTYSDQAALSSILE